MTIVNIIILAAGLGTRMKSKQAKVLHRAGGRALIEHVVAAAGEISPAENGGSIVAVTGHQADQVEALLAPTGIKFARQTEQKGTGHAVECARSSFPDHEHGVVMVLYGDTPLLTAATLARLRDVEIKSQAAATLITTPVDDPTGYGRVIVDETGRVSHIVEHRDCTPLQLKVKLINSGIYCFRADLLWKFLGELKPNNASGEFYLTDMAEILNRHGHRVQALHIDDPGELLGINTRIELADADRILRRRKADQLMLSGVTIYRPETVSIDIQVEVGEDTIIEPFTRLTGSTLVGDDCRICAGSILENATIERGVLIKPYSLIADSRIQTGAQIGPFSRLRMNAEIGEDVRIGNFVEVKKSKIAKGAKAQHLAYLGDASIGAKANIGAGTITCNYDGEKKHETTIGDGAFIGSNSTLVAPIEIGPGSYVAAGSVITKKVPPETLAIGRARQENKPEWIARRKKKAEPRP
jgi:bifunctional UDP-N-acetylglucosamine pyrophosphorylase / glucosamine-1-phosphate N-acetyltransferase